MNELQIRYFLQVADCMSFSQAAKALYVSQPSVSRQVQQLEQELGIPLFDRSNKSRIALTPAGMVFRDSFRKMQSDFRQTLSAAQEMNQRTKLRISLGIGENWDFSALLSRFAQRAEEKSPGAELHFVQEPFHHLRSQVRAGDLDAALCTRTGVQEYEGLELAAVGSVHSCYYLKAGLVRPAGEAVQLRDLVGLPLLMLPEEEAPMSTQIVLLHLQQICYHPQVFHLPNRASILQSLLLGQGFAPLDDRMELAHDSRLTRIQLEEKIPLCVIWKQENQNPLIRLFLEVASEEGLR